MRVIVPAKINLALHVTGRRADGYHLLDSVVVFAEWGDVLEVSPADDRRLTVEGPFAEGVPTGPENLIWRAVDLLDPGRGAHIRVQKNIPHGAGLGGGTADAAAALRGLAELWGVPMPGRDALLTVGADLPVCVYGQPVRMRGIGEVLDPLKGVPPLHVVLTRQRDVGASTGAVFGAMERVDNPGVSLWDGAEDFPVWLGGQRNDLEPATEAVVGGFGPLRAALDRAGAGLVRMTGSGTAFFGLFGDAQSAEAAAESVRADGFWAQAVRTGGN